VLLSWIGYDAALWSMAAMITVALVAVGVLLDEDIGRAKVKPKLRSILSKSTAINRLSAARFFLFGSRDIWFVVALPIFLTDVFGWSFEQVGGFLAAWLIGYGIVQSFAPRLLRRSIASVDAEIGAARTWAFVLAMVSASMAVGVALDVAVTAVVVGGLIVFGVVFAINSSLHSYLILAYSQGDDVSLDVGFYYSANATGARLVGTLLSGVLYLWGGLELALWGSSAFVAITWLLTLRLPALAAGRRRLCRGGGTLHLIGLLSDGNVHSNISHLFEILRQAAEDGISTIRIHALFDGRDVADPSAERYIDRTEAEFAKYPSVDIRFASGGGRMVTTMDRYGAELERRRGGLARPRARRRPSRVRSARGSSGVVPPGCAAISCCPRSRWSTSPESPSAPIVDGDAVVMFNFRGDRAIELSQAFEAGPDFDEFDRRRVPDVCFAGMALYDGDTNTPASYLVEPESVDTTVSEIIASAGIAQWAAPRPRSSGTSPTSGTATARASSTSSSRPTSRSRPISCRSTSDRG
jgi:hypothetical protein